MPDAESDWLYSPEQEIYPLPWPLQSCGICGWIVPEHGVTCPIYWMIHGPWGKVGPLISGLPEV